MLTYKAKHVLASFTKLQKKTHNTSQLQKKTQYMWNVPIVRLQRSQHKYIVLKRLSGLETLPNN